MSISVGTSGNVCMENLMYDVVRERQALFYGNQWYNNI